MSAPGSEAMSVRYYCTAGKGLEPFLRDEVRRKLAANDVCQVAGKVLFSSTARIHRVTELKAAERLFLLLKHDTAVQLSARTSPAKAASVLQSRLLGDENQWTSAALTWSRLQVELADRRANFNTTTSARDVRIMEEEEEGGRNEQMGKEVGCDVATGKSAQEEREEGSGTRRLRGGGEGNEEKKRKREGDESSRDSYDVENHVLEKKVKINNEEESSSDKTVKKQRTSVIQQEIEGENDDEEEKKMVTVLRSSRIGSDTVSHVPVSFRISCKCTGSLSRHFSTQDVSRVIGVGLGRLLGWKADLKNPKLEVNVHLSDDYCLLGIPLTRLPLANRSYIKTTGLRSTVAWAMASLAQIKPGSRVVDPMCGVGTILIEAAQEHKDACFLGVDIDDSQLQRANENIEFGEVGSKIELLKASSMVLPLPSASVDAVVCDLPFGRKFGTKTNMAANLPVIVTEMERILCVGGTLVLLLSPQLSCLLKKQLGQKDFGQASNQETKPHAGIQDSPNPSLSSGNQTRTGLHPSLPSPLSSLKHQATYRVSLGAIDGLIHKYIKTDA